MREKDKDLADKLDTALLEYSEKERPLLGLEDQTRRNAFIEQLIESVRRVKYVSVIATRKLSIQNTDPCSDMFDPVKAAIVYKSQGRIKEAFWMVFLFTHFGRDKYGTWRYAKDVYRGMGDSIKWSWEEVCKDPAVFAEWIKENSDEIKNNGPGGFGNHRKYESLEGTGFVVQSYVEWVNPPRTHVQLFQQAQEEANDDPKIAFDILYNSMNEVERFGRLAVFDYLTMIGKMSLAKIEPGSAYLDNSSGPLDGAKLLFFNGDHNESSSTLDEWLIELDNYLVVGMQVIEDALCNWQKRPDQFIPFRG